jgi:hypothetical protein
VRHGAYDADTHTKRDKSICFRVKCETVPNVRLYHCHMQIYKLHSYSYKSIGFLSASKPDVILYHCHIQIYTLRKYTAFHALYMFITLETLHVKFSILSRRGEMIQQLNPPLSFVSANNLV